MVDASPSLGEVSPQELSLLTQAAEQGHAEAQWQLGLIYASGDSGLRLDYVRAAGWIEQAAKQGFARAQSVLAWLFANGLGVRQDNEQAGFWYLRAAEQGGARDQYMVATMYRFGRYGAPRDAGRMLHWYQLAADQGFAPAQYALGRLLLDGTKVPQDLETAFQWLSLAQVNGSSRAEPALKSVIERLPAERLQALKAQMLAAGSEARRAI